VRRAVAGGALALCLAVGLALFASCKQKEGERCQIDDDCEEPLVCAQATQTCADNDTSSSIDALPPPDAPLDAFEPLDAPAAK